MVCFLRQSWQGGSLCDSASPFLAQNKLYHNASMLLVAYNLNTNSSNFTCKFGGSFYGNPSCANASLNSAFAFNIVSAWILPFPANVLTVSQPIKACIPSNALHIIWSNGCCHVWDINETGASFSATLLKQWSMYVASECKTEDEDICIICIDHNCFEYFSGCMICLKQ